MTRKMLFLVLAAVLPVAGRAGALQPRNGDALGRLATAKLLGETVSYAYNVRNALTSITSPRFSQQLRYAAGAANPCYNGNIAEAVTQGNKYAYTYDNANRLTAAKYTPSAGNADYSSSYTYDRNSNITALTRKGLKNAFGNYSLVDDLTMIYSSNRLWRVTDHAGEVLLENSGNLRNPEIFDPSETQFGYDANGNTVKDLSRNIETMCYNPINLPLSTQLVQGTDRLTGATTRRSVGYTYDASGVRHRVIHTTQPMFGTRPLKIATADTTDYVGNYVIRNGQIDKILTPYGYMQDGRHHTFLHDYQGNVAAVVVGDSVAQRNSYYPYGLPHYTGIVKKTSFLSSSMTANPYKYGGKEYDTFGGTDLYDFHARQLAPSVPRFLTPDPLAEDYYGYSIYQYCMGNPIAFIDPSGLGAFWHNGTEIGTDGINDGKIFALKTTESSFTEGDHTVPGAGLSKDALKAAISFIKSNNGNSEAFRNNSIAYDNSVQIESSAENRQIMVNEVSRDDGKGGTEPKNNREYGGAIIDGVAKPQSQGPVKNPGAGESGEFYTSFGVPTFHSHPSGTIDVGESRNSFHRRGTTLGSRRSETFGHYQIPSTLDINAAEPGTLNYVFGRGNGNVYVYDNTGVQAVIPMKNFVNPKIKRKK